MDINLEKTVRDGQIELLSSEIEGDIILLEGSNEPIDTRHLFDIRMLRASGPGSVKQLSTGETLTIVSFACGENIGTTVVRIEK